MSPHRPVRVRGAARADLPALEALERESFGAGAYPGFFLRQALDLWGGLFLVAEEGEGDPIGYALAAPSERPGEACVLTAAVRPAARGRGVASRLLGALLEGLAGRGFRSVWLTVHPENGEAVRLYERHGFRRAGEEAEYFGPGEPRVRMERAL